MAADSIRHADSAARLSSTVNPWTRADDGLPERLLSEPLEVASGRAATLTRERLDAMIAGYYSARGLDPSGVLTEDGLEDLGIPVPTRNMHKIVPVH